MLFFRSEERVREWCTGKGYAVQPLVRLHQLWELARAWYATRLDANSRRPQPDEIRRIFRGVGLTGDFWDPQSDVFGREGGRPL